MQSRKNPSSTDKLLKCKGLLEAKSCNISHKNQLKDCLSLSSEEKKHLEMQEEQTAFPLELKKLALEIKKEAQMEGIPAIYIPLIEKAYLAGREDALTWLRDQVTYELYKKHVSTLLEGSAKNELISKQMELDSKPLKPKEKIEKIVELLVEIRPLYAKQLLQILKADPNLLSQKKEVKTDPIDQKLQTFEALPFAGKVAFIQNPSEASFIPTVLEKGSQEAVSAAYEALLLLVSRQDSNQSILFFETYYSPSSFGNDFKTYEKQWNTFKNWFLSTLEKNSPFKQILVRNKVNLFLREEYSHLSFQDKISNVACYSQGFLNGLKEQRHLLDKNDQKKLDSLSWTHFHEIEELSLKKDVKPLIVTETPLRLRLLPSSSALKRFLQEIGCTLKDPSTLGLGMLCFAQLLEKEMKKAGMSNRWMKTLNEAFQKENLEQISELASHIVCLKYLNALGAANKKQWKDRQNGPLLKEEEVIAASEKSLEKLSLEEKAKLQSILEGEFFLQSLKEDLAKEAEFLGNWRPIEMETSKQPIDQKLALYKLSQYFCSILSEKIKSSSFDKKEVWQSFLQIANSHRDFSFLHWLVQKLVYEDYLSSFQKEEGMSENQPIHHKLESLNLKKPYGCFNAERKLTEGKKIRNYLAEHKESSAFYQFLQAKNLDYKTMIDEETRKEIDLFALEIVREIEQKCTKDSSVYRFFHQSVQPDIANLDAIKEALKSPMEMLEFLLSKKELEASIEHLNRSALEGRFSLEDDQIGSILQNSLSPDEIFNMLGMLLEKDFFCFYKLFSSQYERFEPYFLRILQEKILDNDLLFKEEKIELFKKAYLYGEEPDIVEISNAEKLEHEKAQSRIQNWLADEKIVPSLKKALKNPNFFDGVLIYYVRDVFCLLAIPYFKLFVTQEEIQDIEDAIQLFDFKTIDKILEPYIDEMENEPFDPKKAYSNFHQLFKDCTYLLPNFTAAGWTACEELSDEENAFHQRLFVQKFVGFLKALLKSNRMLPSSSSLSEITKAYASKDFNLLNDIIQRLNSSSEDKTLPFMDSVFKSRQKAFKERFQFESKEDLSAHQRAIEFDRLLRMAAQQVAGLTNITPLHLAMIDEASAAKSFNALHCLKHALQTT
jgi:hypothetical protein